MASFYIINIIILLLVSLITILEDGGAWSHISQNCSFTNMLQSIMELYFSIETQKSGLTYLEPTWKTVN